jgi:hypothetical protein
MSFFGHALAPAQSSGGEEDQQSCSGRILVPKLPVLLSETTGKLRSLESDTELYNEGRSALAKLRAGSIVLRVDICGADESVDYDWPELPIARAAPQAI